MDLFPKYIIEDGNLILSRCSYHRELVTDKADVKGGGWFSVKDNVWRFHGDSHEFGKAKLEDVQRAVNEDKVFTNKYLTHSIANTHKFVYDTGTEIIELNNGLE